MASGGSLPASNRAANRSSQNLPPGVPTAAPQPSESAPSKRDLVSWWTKFKKNTKKVEEPVVAPPSEIFGVPLNISIKYANVAISLTGDDGRRFIYGYVPIVVAKCGVFLKEKATEVEGIFRLSGSAKRIKDLQELFDTSDRYGKGLDWTGFTVHDASNVLRRYLNQLPEPIVPLDFYERFREPLRHLRDRKSVSGDEGIAPKDPPYNREEVVSTYQKLITELPALNRQLLLYILDLLTVFAAKADINRMTAANLAAIFQPGMLSHPDHYMSPQDYRLSQDVLVFLIDNQDNFIIGMNGTAADEQTVKDVESGMVAAQQASSVRRTASNASGGADSLRKYEVTLRRNVSVSSKNSRTSAGNASPTTPSAGRSPSMGGVHRSNTVPSKRPAGLSPKIYQQRDSDNAPPSGVQKSVQSSRSSSRTPSRAPSINTKSISSPLAQTNFPPTANPDVATATSTQTEQQKDASGDDATSQMLATATPISQPAPVLGKEKKRSSLFGWASPPDDGRQPNRLRKKRLPTSSASESAHSSTNSLPTGSEDALLAVSAAHSMLGSSDSVPEPTSTPRALDTISDKEREEHAQPVTQGNVAVQAQTENLSKIEQSRSHASSVRSRESITDLSDVDKLEDAEKKDKRRSWRLHRGSRSSRDHTPASISSNARAQVSHSSFGSAAMSQENVAAEPHRMNKDSQANLSGVLSPPQQTEGSASGVTSPSEMASPREEGDRHGFFGKFKAKFAQVKEELKDEFRDGERVRSPPHGDGEKSSSRNSLSIFSSRDNKNARGAPLDNVVEQKPQEQRPTTASTQASVPIASTTVSQPPAIPEKDTPGQPTAEQPVTSASTSTEPVTTATATVLTTVQEDVPLTIPESESITATAAPPPSTVIVPGPSDGGSEVEAKPEAEGKPEPKPEEKSGEKPEEKPEDGAKEPAAAAAPS